MPGDDSQQNVGGAGELTRLESLLAGGNSCPLPPVHLWQPSETRNVGLRITGDGAWHYQASPIGRKRLVRLFSTVLRRDEDGRHYLVTPVEKVLVQVDNAPFLAVEMVAVGRGQAQILTFRTNVDDIVRCDAAHALSFEQEAATGGLRPYVDVRDGLRALLTRAIYYDLVALAAVENIDGIDQFGVWSCETFFAMARAETIDDLT